MELAIINNVKTPQLQDSTVFNINTLKGSRNDVLSILSPGVTRKLVTILHILLINKFTR